ncbi:MAG: PIN-like domain-containing protein [Merismopediaceae bacterium]|nr:PIN-like domain-containing protein [Merismopediaceae bacterium]
MKNLFCGYYRPNDDKFREIWRSATFVLDANILLNMYRYPEEAREQLLNVLKSIEKRLWIPYQAALEFQRNRVSVIAEQHKKFLEVRNILKPSQDAIKEATNQLEALQLKKRHSSIQSIQPDELITSLNKQISDFLSKLTELEAKQLSVTNFDPIRENLDQLLIGKVGDPFSQDEINKIYKEGEARFKNEIPPGVTIQVWLLTHDVFYVSNNKQPVFCSD